MREIRRFKEPGPSEAELQRFHQEEEAQVRANSGVYTRLRLREGEAFAERWLKLCDVVYWSDHAELSTSVEANTFLDWVFGEDRARSWRGQASEYRADQTRMGLPEQLASDAQARLVERHSALDAKIADCERRAQEWEEALARARAGFAFTPKSSTQ